MDHICRKILVVSDTHGDPSNVLSKIIDRESPFDLLIHCGDVSCDLDRYEKNHAFPILVVRGNTDSRHYPRIADTKIGYMNVLVVHGDAYDVNETNQLLVRFAIERCADIVLFGHTHIPEIFHENGILFVNPGSPVRPKRNYPEGTYAVLEMDPELYGCIPSIRSALTGNAVSV